MAKHDWQAILRENDRRIDEMNDDNYNDNKPQHHPYIIMGMGLGVLLTLIVEFVGVWATMGHIPKDF